MLPAEGKTGTGPDVVMNIVTPEPTHVALSVAICTHNGARYLREQLNSIISQSRLPEELVICDDRSGDETLDIINAFAAQAPFAVRVFANPEQLGLVKNFEKAIELCRGEIIALADQDDVWQPEKLQRLEQALLSAPDVGLVFSDAEVVDEHLKPLGSRLWDFWFTPQKRRSVRNGAAVGAMLRGNFVTGATMAFKAKFKETILPIPTGTPLIHDGWIALVIAVLADLAFVDERLILYRQHRQQFIGVGNGGTEPVPEDHRSRSEILGEMANRYRADFEDLKPSLERIKESCVQHHWTKGAAKLEAGIADHQGLVEHYRERARITSGQPITRLPAILKEVCNRRYHQYSKGFYSAVRDVVL